jgi:hypothetical protein
LARPLWSAGIAAALSTPFWWQRRQSARLSKLCGIAGGSAAVLAAGGGVGDGVGAGAGVGFEAGAGVDAGAPPQATIIDTIINSTTTKTGKANILFLNVVS